VTILLPLSVNMRGANRSQEARDELIAKDIGGGYKTKNEFRIRSWQENQLLLGNSFFRLHTQSGPQTVHTKRIKRVPLARGQSGTQCAHKTQKWFSKCHLFDQPLQFLQENRSIAENGADLNVKRQ
jgi:hypothetical protein